KPPKNGPKNQRPNCSRQKTERLSKLRLQTSRRSLNSLLQSSTTLKANPWSRPCASDSPKQKDEVPNKRPSSSLNPAAHRVTCCEFWQTAPSPKESCSS